MLWVGTKAIPGCLGCGKCGNAGMCVYDDMVNRIHERLDEFDGIVVGSPVYYGGISGQLKCIEAGEKNGVERPVYEERAWTHFIR